MRELFEWFDRLATLGPDGKPTLRMKRVASPPTLAFDASVIRVDDGGEDAHPFGVFLWQISRQYLDTVVNNVGAAHDSGHDEQRPADPRRDR